jgi:hypothetical protein
LAEVVQEFGQDHLAGHEALRGKRARDLTGAVVEGVVRVADGNPVSGIGEDAPSPGVVLRSAV